MQSKQLQKIFFIISLTFFNIFITYPRGNREYMGMDSFFYHNAANTILEYGTGKWLLQITSYLGWYPYSFPSGSVFVLAELSIFSGLSVELIIFLFSIVLSFIGSFSIYCLIKQYTNNSIISFISAFIFISIPALLDITIQTFTARYLLIVISIFAFYLLNRILMRKQKRQLKLIILVSCLILILPTIHRTFIFSYAVFISYFVAYKLYGLKKRISVPIRIVCFVVYTSLCYVFGFLIPQLFGFTSEVFKDGILSSSYPFFNYINAAAAISSGYGIISFIIFTFGFIYVSFNLLNSKKFFALSVSFLIVLLFLTSRTYFRTYSSLLLIPYSAFGLLFMFALIKKNKLINRKNLRAKIYVGGIILLICGNILFSNYMIDHWRNTTPSFEESQSRHIESNSLERTYDLSMYVCQDDDGFVTNDRLFARKVQAFSGRMELPASVGYNQHFNYAINGNITTENIDTKVLNFDDLSFKTDVLYKYEVKNDLIYLFFDLQSQNITDEEVKATLSRYDCNILITSNKAETQYFHWDNLRNSTFQETSVSYRFKIYDNGQESVRFLQ